MDSEVDRGSTLPNPKTQEGELIILTVFVSSVDQVTVNLSLCTTLRVLREG